MVSYVLIICVSHFAMTGMSQRQLIQGAWRRIHEGKKKLLSTKKTCRGVSTLHTKQPKGEFEFCNLGFEMS